MTVAKHAASRCRRIAVLGLLLAITLSIGAASQNTDYSIMSWAYGVVIWPGQLNTYLTVPERFVERLEAAAEEAFGFWGYELPEPEDEWPCPVRYAGRLLIDGPYDVRIVDEATGRETVVPSLEWSGARLSPFVVIPFVGEWRMHDALGTTATFGAQFFDQPLVRTYPDAEDWIHEVGRGYRTMICASYAGDDVLIHEFAHWFQWEWCSGHDVLAMLLPGFIREGMAEMTAAEAENLPHAPWERRGVIDWAEGHCLADGVGAASRYTVGESFMTYLVEQLGTEGFLATLKGWTSDPVPLIERHEPGWRVWLGLPESCGSDSE